MKAKPKEYETMGDIWFENEYESHRTTRALVKFKRIKPYRKTKYANVA